MAVAEKSFTTEWHDIAQLLLPKDELWRFGGEIYVVYEDGSKHYQDEFGRTSGAHEYLRRKKRKTDPAPNDNCGCGSGRKLKLCCRDLPQADRPTWDVYGIRERNLMFCKAVQDILWLNSGKTWDDVRRELNDEQVKRIHEAFGSLWPSDTDLAELLPRARKDTFRAVYLGVADPRRVAATIIGWLPYFDQVVLAHPFVNPQGVRPEFSPTKSPSQHKAQTIKNAFLLLLLEPYIHAGYVHLIPDPADFNPQFGISVRQMAAQRTVGWKPDRKSMGWLGAIAKDDHRRLIRQLPDSWLKHLMRQQTPEVSDTEIEEVIADMKSELDADPFALLQPIEPGEAGAQFQYYKGYSLESAMYLASLTGSAIYTDVEAHWQQLNMHAQKASQTPNTAWAPVLDSLRAIHFPIEMNLQTLYEALRAGRFGSIRGPFRQLAGAVLQTSDVPHPEMIALQLTKAARALESEWDKVPKTLRLAGQVELSIPAGGYERNDVTRLLLSFGRAKSVCPIPLAMLIKLEAATATKD